MTTAKQQLMKYNIPSFNVNYPALHILLQVGSAGMAELLLQNPRHTVNYFFLIFSIKV